jgi:N-acetylneuraminic acid mutarotase
MPTPRGFLVAAGVNGIVYAIGGALTAATQLPTVEAYNPRTNTWTSKASLPNARAGASGAAVINGEIYVPGGVGVVNGSSAATRGLFVYKAGRNRWTRRAPLPVPTAGGVAAATGGKLYVYTPGQVNNGPPRLHRYDPATNSWTELATPPNDHGLGIGGAIGGRLYVAGGADGTGTVTAILDVYDLATNTWAPKAGMAEPRTFLAAAMASGVLYALGGDNTNAILPTNEAYTP